MNLTEKRIKIAEACGWKLKKNRAGGLQLFSSVGKYVAGTPYDDGQTAKDLIGFAPDYFNDLNACRDMRKLLTFEQELICTKHLFRLTGGCECNIAAQLITLPRILWFVADATAAQHAEAFGLTLKLWEPDPPTSSQ